MNIHWHRWCIEAARVFFGWFCGFYTTHAAEFYRQNKTMLTTSLCLLRAHVSIPVRIFLSEVRGRISAAGPRFLSHWPNCTPILIPEKVSMQFQL